MARKASNALNGGNDIPNQSEGGTGGVSPGGGAYAPDGRDPRQAGAPYPGVPGARPMMGGYDAANQPVYANMPSTQGRQGSPQEGKFPNSFVNLQSYLYANPGASQGQLAGLMSPGSQSMAGVGPGATAPAQSQDQSPGGTLASGGGASGSQYGGTAPMSVPQQRSGMPYGTAAQSGQPQGAATGGQNMSTANNVQGANYVQDQRRTLFPRLASLLQRQ